MPLIDKKENREYQKKYHKVWYEKNKQARIKQIHERRDTNRLWVKEYKQDKCCSQCGESHPATFDFHHTEDNKEINIANALNLGWSIERIKKEISKCIILCSNCHRKHHYGG